MDIRRHVLRASVVGDVGLSTGSDTWGENTCGVGYPSKGGGDSRKNWEKNTPRNVPRKQTQVENVPVLKYHLTTVCSLLTSLFYSLRGKKGLQTKELDENEYGYDIIFSKQCFY